MTGASLTDEQLATMRRPPYAKRVRRSLGLSQEAFAERFGIPLRTLQEWEEGREPDGATLSYLKVIEEIPDAVAGVLAGNKR